MSEGNKNIQLEFDLGENGGKWNFSTLEELSEWLAQQRGAWSWLAEAVQKESDLERIRQTQDSEWYRIIEYSKRFQNYSVEQKLRGIDELRSQIVQAHQGWKVINRFSTRAKHIETLRKKDVVSAGYALAFYLRIHGNGSAKEQRGTFLALAQEYGLYDAANAEKAQLAEMTHSWQAFRESSKKDFSEENQQRKILRAEIDLATAAQKTQFEQLVESSKAQFKGALKEAKDNLNVLQKTYDDKMALQAAVTYWKAKAESHKDLAKKFSIAAVVSFAIVGFGLYKTFTLIGGETKLSELELWKIGMVAIVATVGVWFLRVLVRLLLSNVHLHTDASERRTMMMTYLALLRRGQLPEGNERELILQALFRPSSTGIVKDDASPPFMAEWLKRTTGVDP